MADVDAQLGMVLKGVKWPLVSCPACGNVLLSREPHYVIKACVDCGHVLLSDRSCPGNARSLTQAEKIAMRAREDADEGRRRHATFVESLNLIG